MIGNGDNPSFSLIGGGLRVVLKIGRSLLVFVR